MDNIIPFQTIEQACKTTGLSQYYLRKGCKDGSVPHRKSGNKYYIDIPALLEQRATEAPGGSKIETEKSEAARRVEITSPFPSARKQRKRQAKDESQNGIQESLEGQVKFQ